MHDIHREQVDMEAAIERERQRLIALIGVYGWERGIRIFGCDRPHFPGITCICGAGVH